MGQLKIYQAPMQGLTDFPFRNAFEKHFGGVDAYYTPFIRWEHGGVRKKDLRDITLENNKVKRLVPQLIAGSAEEAERILMEIGRFGYKEIDLNLGCSFPIMVGKGKGCGILPYPERVKDLLQIAERHPEVSFSVKMRLGYKDAEECMALLPVLNDVPLLRVVVHARTGGQQYKGECNRAAFKVWAEQCAHPVVYNGDIRTLDELLGLKEEFPFLEGVMLGRGLLATPWIAAEYASGMVWNTETRLERLRALHADLLDHYEQTLEGGEKQLLLKMKSFWEYLLPDGNRKLHKRIHKAQKITDYTRAVFQMLH